MKKTALLVLTALFILVTASCSQSDTLYDNGLEVVAMVDETLKPLQGQTANENIKSILDKSSGNYTTPNVVYQLTLSEDSMTKLTDMVIMSGAPYDSVDSLTDRVLWSFMWGMNSIGGTDVLEVISAFNASTTFTDSAIENHKIYLYCYDGAYPVLVIYTPSDNGNIKASGYPILHFELDTSSEESVEAFFDDGKYESTELDVDVKLLK